ncbi:hypothetical protein [Serratia fonticola]|uniref:hypothetical protein n=1 Tax=Serratia fonticola TaxID=47917 RepID=UPI003B0079C2
MDITDDGSNRQNLFEKHCNLLLVRFRETMAYFYNKRSVAPSQADTERYEALLEEVIKQSGNGKNITTPIFINYNFNAIAKQKFQNYFPYILGYYLSARFNHANNEIDKAWSDLSEACYYLGEIAGICQQRYPVSLATQEHEGSLRSPQSIAGKTKALRFHAIKYKLVELLEEQKPEQGWPSKDSAVNAIFNRLLQFNKERGNPLTPTNLSRIVLKWSRKDETIKAAFARVVTR